MSKGVLYPLGLIATGVTLVASLGRLNAQLSIKHDRKRKMAWRPESHRGRLQKLGLSAVYVL